VPKADSQGGVPEPAAPPDWQPSAPLHCLQQRAQLYSRIRSFFAERGVMEVDLPLLGNYSVTDPYMPVIRVEGDNASSPRFLQTSPEYAMKRLLAAGSGAIYQLGKAFRADERGSRHNPEFTLLEWYRPGFDDRALMAEIEGLIEVTLGYQHCDTLSYRDAFMNALDIDPHKSTLDELKEVAKARIDLQMQSDNRDDWLNLLLAETIEPGLGIEAPVFLYNYPASQAALARIEEDEHGVAVARRFELYIRGIELANGYYELTDAAEQAERFDEENKLSNSLGKEGREADPRLLAALAHGLPDCAGVALGVDRLLMLMTGASTIDEVMAFPVEKA
jgi:lysyl-tRNA synthetase class 2